MSEPLTLTESARLVKLEATIAKGIGTFIEVGEALAEIRDSRLYKIEHGTFEDYCRIKWGFTRMQASRLIGAAEVCNQLVTEKEATILPTTESQARPLTKLETPAEQREAWQEAVEQSATGRPTAKEVEAAVEIVSGKKEAPKDDATINPSDAMQYASMAIDNLRKIHPRDSKRAEAFEKVLRYINTQTK